jgi:hypothetical protein
MLSVAHAYLSLPYILCNAKAPPKKWDASQLINCEWLADSIGFLLICQLLHNHPFAREYRDEIGTRKDGICQRHRPQLQVVRFGP